MAVPEIRQPAKPELIYTVRHGVTKNRLAYAVATFAEAEQQAKTISSEGSHTVEICHEKMIFWNFQAVKKMKKPSQVYREGF